MVLENLNFPEAEKKFLKPTFRYMDEDFPALSSAKAAPTVQEEVNKIMTSFPYSSIVQTKRKTPMKSNVKPYIPPPVGIPICDNSNPVIGRFLENRVTEYERILALILEKTRIGAISDSERMISEIAEIAKEVCVRNEPTSGAAVADLNSTPSVC